LPSTAPRKPCMTTSKKGSRVSKALYPVFVIGDSRAFS
jgi:hypothetical protein